MTEDIANTDREPASYTYSGIGPAPIAAPY
jgi:hypothetical protein